MSGKEKWKTTAQRRADLDKKARKYEAMAQILRSKITLLDLQGEQQELVKE